MRYIIEVMCEELSMEEEKILYLENFYGQTAISIFMKHLNFLNESKKEIKERDVKNYILKQGLLYTRVCYTVLNKALPKKEGMEILSDEDEEEEEEGDGSNEEESEEEESNEFSDEGDNLIKEQESEAETD